MFDLTVVGAGFWGLITALSAKNYGLDVCLVDNGEKRGGSTNAGGMLSENWFTNNKKLPKWWDSKSIGYSIELLQEYANLTKVEQDIWNLQTGNKKVGSVWMLPDPNVFLSSFPLSNRVIDKIIKLEKCSGGWSVIGENSTIQSKKVVVAAGIWTTELLENSNLCPIQVKKHRGKAFFVENCSVKNPLQIRPGNTDPYFEIECRPWINGLVRVGNTTNRFKKLNKHRKCFTQQFPECKEVKEIVGYRPKCKIVVVEWVSNGLVVATGGDRIGLGIAPVAARESLRLLGIKNCS